MKKDLIIQDYTRELISELGGSVLVMKFINEKMELNISRQAVCNWYKKGIPLKYLKLLCDESVAYNIEDFLPELF
mgnify:CR=1 FL=1|tara:strand:+ start:41 stop:265 length:225 start_codon:yes stop_codon:yes gene_type:complete